MNKSTENINKILLPIFYLDIESNKFKQEFSYNRSRSLKWYKSLPIHTRINIKDVSNLLFGTSFELLIQLMTLKEYIDMTYYKLKKEGFDIK